MSVTSMNTDLKFNYPPWRLINTTSDIITDMIRRFGIKDVVAQDINNLDDLLELQNATTYGIILVYPYTEEALPEDIEIKDQDADNIVFSCQVVYNSCATISTINILSNTDIPKGDPIQNFLHFTEDFDPVNRGLALGNIQEIRDIHNSYKDMEEETESSDDHDSQEGSQEGPEEGGQYEYPDTYHYVSYIFREGSIWELDGLKGYPLKHGSEIKSEEWLEPLKKLLAGKLESNELEANIIAIIKDPIVDKKDQLQVLYKQHKDLEDHIHNTKKNPDAPSGSGSIKRSQLKPEGWPLLQKKNEMEGLIKNLEKEISDDKNEIDKRIFSIGRERTDYFASITQLGLAAVEKGLDLQYFKYPPSELSKVIAQKSIVPTSVAEVHITEEKGKPRVEEESLKVRPTESELSVSKSQSEPSTSTTAKIPKVKVTKTTTSSIRQSKRIQGRTAAITPQKIQKDDPPTRSPEQRKRKINDNDGEKGSKRHKATKKRYKFRR